MAQKIPSVFSPNLKSCCRCEENIEVKPFSKLSSLFFNHVRHTEIVLSLGHRRARDTVQPSIKLCQHPPSLNIKGHHGIGDQLIMTNSIVKFLPFFSILQWVALRSKMVDIWGTLLEEIFWSILRSCHRQDEDSVFSWMEHNGWMNASVLEELLLHWRDDMTPDNWYHLKSGLFR